ncbi:MAG: hypothetical protein IJ021_10045 [Clostridia bacterium]|nr:hypothetical protein [Clostridia bacterium]
MMRGSWATGGSDNEAKNLLKKIESPVFDKIRGMEEFVKIKERLAEYAGKWNVE